MAGQTFDVQLTPSQFRQLVAAREDVEAAHRLLDKAQAAGIDVTAARDELNRREAQRQGLLSQFAPKTAGQT